MPVINPPQVAILGVGRVVSRPGILDGQIRAVSVLPLSLVFDHRAVDGTPAAAFLDAIGAALGEPEQLLG
jgi:pyruvate dehydrogenase E2 component (dihydrolipoamide acetyltransferase)